MLAHATMTAPAHTGRVVTTARTGVNRANNRTNSSTKAPHPLRGLAPAHTGSMPHKILRGVGRTCASDGSLPAASPLPHNMKRTRLPRKGPAAVLPLPALGRYSKYGCAFPSTVQAQQCTRRAAVAARASAGKGDGGRQMEDDSVDFTTFRFTLGISGLEDRLVPRVVGSIALALLAVNHATSAGGGIPGVQARAELIGVFLSFCCIIAPYVSLRLKDNTREGRQQRTVGAGGDASSADVFCLSDTLPGGQRVLTELAWSAYALLRKCNCSTVVVWWQDSLVCARGTASKSALQRTGQKDDKARDLASLEASLRMAVQGSPVLSGVAASGNAAWLADRGALEAAGAGKWSFLPSTARCALVLPLQGEKDGKRQDARGFLMLVGESDRSLGRKQRLWAVTIADKLASSL
eukprot:jgi/Mesvir1/4486/Mv14583-RA.1